MALLNVQSQEVHHFQLFAIIVMDYLWFYRNQLIHGSNSSNITQFVTNNTWEPPDIGHISVAFDEAVRIFGGVAAAVCRDHLGNILGCVTKFSSICNLNDGEAFIVIKMAVDRK